MSSDAIADRSARFGYLLREWELFTFQNCQPYDVSWLSAFLALSRAAPVVITLVLFAGGFRYREVYLFLFGFGLLFDEATNYTINYVATGTPRLAGCLPVYGNTLAYQVQHASFFVTFASGYVALYRPRASLWHFVVLGGFFSWAVLGAHFLNYHTPAAILAGAALGAINACVYQSLVHWFLVPHFGWFVAWRYASFFEYQDNLVGVYEVKKQK